MRWAMNAIIGAAWLQQRTVQRRSRLLQQRSIQRKSDPYPHRFRHQFFGLPPTLEVDAQGKVQITENPAWLLFRKALAGVEAQRLKRCPIETCRRVYYAKRSDALACDKHLGLAAVHRVRGKIPMYNEHRRANRRTRQGMSIGDALKSVSGVSTRS